MMAAVGWAWFRILTSATSHRNAFVEALIILVGGMMVTTLWYALTQEDHPMMRSPTALSRRRMMAQLRGVGYAVAMMFVMAVPFPILEAAIIKRRFRMLIKAGVIDSEKGVEQIVESLGVAKQAHLKLPLNTLAPVRDVIKVTAIQKPDLANLWKAATALTEYARLIYPLPPEVINSHNEGVAAFYRGKAMQHPGVGPKEIEAAIAEYTKAIALADRDTELKAHALMARAGNYNLLQRYSEALRDAQQAEELGSLDLDLIATVEGQALVHLSRSRGDLQRAVGLITLRLEMASPPLSPDTRLFSFRLRAEANYGLGNFAEAVNDYRQFLSAIKVSEQRKRPNFNIGEYFAILVYSYLRLDNVEAAIRVSSELEELTNDSRFGAIRQILIRYSAAPQLAIAMIRQVAPEPPIHDR